MKEVKRELMKFAKVAYEKKEGIALITLDNQKKLNVLGSEVKSELHQALDEVERDDEVRVAILTGAGRAFCAGTDISELGSLHFDINTVRRVITDSVGLFRRPETLSKPVIAAVNGLCLGGGLELAIACDMIIACEEAQFGTFEIKRGLVPGFALLRLPQIIGRPKAKEMILTGNSYSAQEALDMGLVNKVVLAERLMDEATAIARTIKENAATALRFTKSAINRQLGGEELTYMADGVIHVFQSEDAKEGLRAFIEKREPKFIGK